ncbi:hypothetical protein CEXT_423131, partial [Caerostris extrusa]
IPPFGKVWENAVGRYWNSAIMLSLSKFNIFRTMSGPRNDLERNA